MCPDRSVSTATKYPQRLDYRLAKISLLRGLENAKRFTYTGSAPGGQARLPGGLNPPPKPYDDVSQPATCEEHGRDIPLEAVGQLRMRGQEGQEEELHRSLGRAVEVHRIHHRIHHRIPTNDKQQSQRLKADLRRRTLLAVNVRK